MADLDPLLFLRLLQLADSALPIGGVAHSFGLETLVAHGSLTIANLPQFLTDYLQETGTVEAAFCMQANSNLSAEEWQELNQTLSALRPAYETRNASLVLGRRFLNLAASLGIPEIASHLDTDTHLCAAFGRVAWTLGIDSLTGATAFLHQSLAAMISSCQRLMPLGQHRAARILWNLKPALLRAVGAAQEVGHLRVTGFTPALEIASMQHPYLTTRLFIS